MRSMQMGMRLRGIIVRMTVRMMVVMMMGMTRHTGLLPFNGARRFRGDVVDHAIDAAHVIDDARGDVAQ